MTTKMSAPASPVKAEDEKGNVKDKKTWLENVFNKKSPGESTASDSNPPTPSSPGLVEDRHKWIEETLLSKSDDGDLVKKVELLSEDLAVPSFGGEDRSACDHTANTTKDEEKFKSLKEAESSVVSGHTDSIVSFDQSPEDATMSGAKNGEKEATGSVATRSAESQDGSNVEGDSPKFQSTAPDEALSLDEPPFLRDERTMNTIEDSHEHTVTQREERSESEMIAIDALEQEKKASGNGETDPVKLLLEVGNDQYEMDHRQPVESVAKQSDEHPYERNMTAKRESSSLTTRGPVEKVAIVSTTVDETTEGKLRFAHEKIEVENTKQEELKQSVETTLIAETTENLPHNTVPDNDDQVEQSKDQVEAETEHTDLTSDNENADAAQVDVVHSPGCYATAETVGNESVEVEVVGEELQLADTPTAVDHNKVDDCPETCLDSSKVAEKELVDTKTEEPCLDSSEVVERELVDTKADRPCLDSSKVAETETADTKTERQCQESSEVAEAELVDTKIDTDENINYLSTETTFERANKEGEQFAGNETENPTSLTVSEDSANCNEPALVSLPETAIDTVGADNGTVPLPIVQGTEEEGLRTLYIEESETVFVGNFETPHKDSDTEQLKNQDDDEETEVVPFVGEFETPHKSVPLRSAKSSTGDSSEDDLTTTKSVDAKSSEDVLAQNTTEETIMISNQTVIENPFEYTMVVESPIKVKDIATTFSSDSSSFGLAQLTPDVTIPVSPTSSTYSAKDELGVNQHRIDPSKLDFLHTRKGKAFVEHARRNAQRFREVKKSVVMSETWCGDATSIRQQTVVDSLTDDGREVAHDGADSPENELTESSTGQQGAVQEEDVGTVGCFESACTIT